MSTASSFWWKGLSPLYIYISPLGLVSALSAPSQLLPMLLVRGPKNGGQTYRRYRLKKKPHLQLDMQILMQASCRIHRVLYSMYEGGSLPR